MMYLFGNKDWGYGTILLCKILGFKQFEVLSLTF